MQNQKRAFQLPQVQLIGAQKSGTSAIADWLFEFGGFVRPKIFGDEPWYYSKEVHFFDNEWRFSQGVGFYAQRFCHEENNILTLDATPDTLPYPERVRSIYEEAGDNQINTVKFIVILREPVSRELSLYNHLAFDCRTLGSAKRNEWHDQVLKADGSIMSFEEFVRQTSIPALERENGPGQSTRHGMYAKHLSKWFQSFAREQILVLTYNELKRDPSKLRKRVQEFLGRKIPGKLEQANALDNPLKVRSPSQESKKLLSAAFQPMNEELFKLLKSNPGPQMEEIVSSFLF